MIRRPRRRYEPRARVQALEMLILFAVSALGIYALGQGLSGLFEPGTSIDLLWLAVLAITIWILFSQMARVHDAWPRRNGAENRMTQPSTEEEVRK